jgi:cytoskeletal protein CcmA (bactofilin family)
MYIKSEMKNIALFSGSVEEKCEIESLFYEGACIGNVP